MVWTALTSPASDESRPLRVSVVVPAFNEAELLPACLEALLAQEHPGDLEIIVVDNASTDATADIARRYGVTVVKEPRRAYGAALARGFGCASGDIIASTDADSVVPCDWVGRLRREYEHDASVAAVGGAIEFVSPNWKGRIFTRVLLPLVNHFDRANRAGPHLWGANLSIRRSAFLAVGGFDPRFSLQADSEISERLRSAGRVLLLPDLLVRSSSRRWNRAFLSSCFLFGMNFAWYQIFGRPMCREFPAIRELSAAAPQASGPRAKTRPPAAGSRRGPPLRPVLAGSLVAGVILFVGYRAVTPRSNEFGTTYWHAATPRRVVALTFDDGPNEPYTSRVLAVLRREHVRATFFLIGANVRRYPRAAAEIVREGHVVGNHSDTHPFGFALEPARRLAAEVGAAEQSILGATGVLPHLFRPPNGLRSPWLMNVLSRDSLVAVTWDDAPGDWDRLSAQRLVALTLRAVHPGSIILLHDGMNLTHGADQSPTVRALPVIIRALRRRGYEFLTVPELLNQPPYLRSWMGRHAT